MLGFGRDGTGVHFQRPPHAQAKLLRVLCGRVLDVVVDLSQDSSTFGQHVAIELSADGGELVFVPVGFAHGIGTLEPIIEVSFKVTDDYAPECDAGILWNDPALGIAWPKGAGASVSERDAALPRLSDIESPFRFSPAGPAS